MTESRPASGAEAIRAAARELFESGAVGDASLRRSGAVGQPIVVHGPRREPHSWFVPLTVGDRLAAFFQFLADATLMRFSTFPSRPGALEGPPASDWLNPADIAGYADAIRTQGEKAGEPFLSFDRTPDRLVWVVPLTSAAGTRREVFVVGGRAYIPHVGDTIG